MELKDIKFIGLGASPAWKTFSKVFAEQEGYDIRARGPFDNIMIRHSAIRLVLKLLQGDSSLLDEYKDLANVGLSDIAYTGAYFKKPTEKVYQSENLIMWPEESLDMSAFAKEADKRCKTLLSALKELPPNYRFIYFIGSEEIGDTQFSDVMQLNRFLIENPQFKDKIIFISWCNFHRKSEDDSLEPGFNRFFKLIKAPHIDLLSGKTINDIPIAIEQFKEQITKFI